jgi:thioredoxin-related protein
MNNLLVVSNIVLWIIVGFQLVITFFLAKLVVQFLNNIRINGSKLQKSVLQKGAPAPLFRVLDQHGELVKLTDNENKITMIMFVKESCGTCKEIYSKLKNIFTLYSKQFNFILITDSKFSEQQLHELEGIHICESEDVPRKYNIEIVPTVVFVDQNFDVIQLEIINNYEKLLNLSSLIALNELQENGA